MLNFDFESTDLNEKLKEIKNKTISLSLIRLLLFLVCGAFFILTFAESIVWGFPFLVSLIVFVRLVNRFNRLKDQEKIYQNLQKILEENSLRKYRNLRDLDSGIEFQEKEHAFANDLDLFGVHSLFQLLNHTVSLAGRRKLAKLMKSNFDAEKARSHYEASQELAKKTSFLFAMESLGKAFWNEETKNKSWKAWLAEKGQTSGLVKILSVVGPLGGTVILVLIQLGLLSATWLGLWIVFGILAVSFVFVPLKKAYETIPSRNQMKSFRYWSAILEKESFEASLLKDNQKAFTQGEGKVSEQLERLDRLGFWIQNRLNILYIPINLIFWTDLFLLVRLNTWKSKNGQMLSEFPEKLSDWEVFTSLGAFEAQLSGKGKVNRTEEIELAGQAISHPLLEEGIAISNDFKLNADHQLVLLTGANMSGKTTFMRTLGINCVLVNIGLSPFAREFTMGAIQLYTSMRNTDNLGESVSSFYAELSRIHTLINRIEGGEPIFFLLDEILKGTNTEDRIAGSKALIHQVTNTKSIGIISTHDIELAQVAEAISRVDNFSFHSEVLDETIDFDYKLKPGACPSFNAHKLMELMGIRFSE